MATVNTLTLYSDKGGSSFVSVTNQYVSSTKYNIYYEIPITYANDRITKLTLKTHIYVTLGGSQRNATVTARLYTSEADAKTYSSSYIATSSTGDVQITATGDKYTFTFSNLNITASKIYVAFKSTTLLEISKTGVTTSITTSPNTYTISYNSNTGSGSQAAGTKTHGVKFTLPECTFTPPNDTSTTYTVTLNLQGGTCNNTNLSVTKTTTYSFAYWTLNGTRYNAGASYTANAAATFYASWSASSTNPEIILPSPIKPGNDFIGWCTNSNGSGTVYAAGTKYAVSSNHTLYAKWGLQTRTLTYDSNGGTPALQTQQLSYGTAITLSFNTPTRKGYNFLGWSDSSSATSATYRSGGNITITEDKTIYAVWQPLSFVITYQTRGGIINDTSYSTSINYNDILKLPTNVSKSKHVFDGWTTKADGSPDGYEWSNKETWNIINGESGVVNNQLTLYAIWKETRFKITYNVYEEEYTPETTLLKNSSLLSLRDVIENKKIEFINYHKFAGWCTSNGRLIDWNLIDSEAIQDANPRTYTVYAKIEPRYKIVYYNEGWKLLDPIYYNGSNWRKLLPNILYK